MLKSDERKVLEERTVMMKAQLELAEKQQQSVIRFNHMRELLRQVKSDAHIMVNNDRVRFFTRANASCWWPQSTNDEAMMAEIHAAVYPIIMRIFDKYERAATEQYDATLQMITGQPVRQTERNLRGIQIRDKAAEEPEAF